MAAYAHTSRSQLRAQLAVRLGDPSMVHWVQLELDEIIDSTLTRWSLYTGFYRARGQFATSAGVALYDITTQATLADYLAETRTDRDELSLMQYMLREPSDPIDGTGMSEQFTFAALVSALQRARDQFLADTLHNQSVLSIVVTPDGDAPSLPDSVIAVRRAIWLSVDGARSNIHLADEHESIAYSSSQLINPGIPEMYSLVGSPQLALKLIPPPVDIGTLELIVASAGAALDPGTAASALGIPDDMCWVVRSLALADLLSRDGPAYDPSRAAFCRAEYEFGTSLAIRSPTVLSCELDGQPVLPSALADLDYAYASPHWQSSALGTPSDVGISEHIIALRPVPDTNSHSVTLDLVRKAILPTLDDSMIQVSREDLAPLLDGCEALAMFKLGGEAVDDTVRLGKQMIGAAMRYNSRLSTLGYADAMSKLSGLESTGPRPSQGSGSGVGALAGQQPGATGQQQQQR